MKQWRSGLIRATYYRHGNKQVAKRLWACVEAERLHLKHLVATFDTVHCPYGNIVYF